LFFYAIETTRLLYARETMKDAEESDFITEEHRKWKLEEAVEIIWLILDQIKLWADNNELKSKKQRLFRPFILLHVMFPLETLRLRWPRTHSGLWEYL
jgi:hypothetical protein